MSLYPVTAEGAGSQDTLKRVYHSSETRRFLGPSIPTAANMTAKVQLDARYAVCSLYGVCGSVYTCAPISLQFSSCSVSIYCSDFNIIGSVWIQILKNHIVPVPLN